MLNHSAMDPDSDFDQNNNEEEEFNLSSAFVSMIASRKGKNRPPPAEEPKVNNIWKQLQYENDSEEDDSEEKIQLKNAKRSLELGVLGCEKALSGDFAEAAKHFTAAIEINPEIGYRFYLNRSFCFDNLNDFENALIDAEKALTLKPEYGKCFFRKGKALKGLKKLEEAEICFRRVLSLEGADCIEATRELSLLRQLAVMDLGYEKEAAFYVANKYNSVNTAVDAVVNGLINLRFNKSKNSSPRDSNSPLSGASNNKKYADNFSNGTSEEDVFMSDDDDYTPKEGEEKSMPTNLWGFKGLWIGNVDPEVSEKKMRDMLGKFGKLTYFSIMRDSSCIIAHYDNPESPTKAISKLQGESVPGVSKEETKLRLRFRPEKDQKQCLTEARLESHNDECYFWRTTGCDFEDRCHMKHIPANKGVDQQPWMVRNKRSKQKRAEFFS